MAENSLSQAVSFINDNSTMEIGLTAEGQPAARSDIVAYHFKRNHRDVLRDIRKLCAKCPESFYQRNFAPVEIDTQIGNGATRKDRAYLLTRDGFSLLVMGFTGAEAVKWKLRYIEAFNALEAAALKYQADLAREAGYMQGRDETLALPGHGGRAQEGVSRRLEGRTKVPGQPGRSACSGQDSLLSEKGTFLPGDRQAAGHEQKRCMEARGPRPANSALYRTVPPAPCRAICWRWGHEDHV